MLIDFHTHLFPDAIAEKTIAHLSEKVGIPAYSDGSLRGLNKQLLSVNAYMGVALPVLTRPESFDSVLRFVQSVNEGYKQNAHRVYSFAGIHPRCEDIEGKMAQIKAQGFKGVKIHPDYQETFIDDEGYIRILNSAIDEDLIVVTHSGFDVGYPQCTHCTPERAARALDMLKGNVKIVFAHFGACQMYEEAYQFLAGRNVYFDTAYVLKDLSKHTFFKMLDKHSADRILFASDSPWQDIQESLDALDALGLDTQTKEKILYKNALRLLGI